MVRIRPSVGLVVRTRGSPVASLYTDPGVYIDTGVGCPKPSASNPRIHPGEPPFHQHHPIHKTVTDCNHPKMITYHEIFCGFAFLEGKFLVLRSSWRTCSVGEVGGTKAEVDVVGEGEGRVTSCRGWEGVWTMMVLDKSKALLT